MYTMGMTGTKWDIFLAALDLFARDGFHNVSVTQIANSAGIRASSIYNHFPCKDALAETMYDYYNDCAAEHLPPLEALLEALPGSTPMETLRRTILSVDPQTERVMGQIFLVAASMPSDVRAKMLIQKNIFQTPQRYLSTLLGRMVEEDMIESFAMDEFLFIYCSVYHSMCMRNTGTHRNWASAAERMLGCYVVAKANRAAG